jgi:D-sedoheptulose 7-phosphate isomerase
MNLNFKDFLAESEKVFSLMNNDEFIDSVSRANEALLAAVTMNKPILLCGNGGSAADALHIAGELIGKFLVDRRPIKALALAADVSSMTSIANDFDYAFVFSRQIQAHGEDGGVLIALSTSGQSKNVLEGAKTARMKGMKVIALTGTTGGLLESLADTCIKIPSFSTPMIQQGHQVVYHYLCSMAERIVTTEST